MGWGEAKGVVRRAIPEHLAAQATEATRNRLGSYPLDESEIIDRTVDATLDTVEVWLESTFDHAKPMPGIPDDVYAAGLERARAGVPRGISPEDAARAAMDIVNEWVGGTWLLFLERYEATTARRAQRLEEAMRSLGNPLFRWNDEERAEIIRRALDDTDAQPFKGGRK